MWKWPSMVDLWKRRPTLESVERIFVMVAALAALLPLYQYYAERHDRRLDRAVNLVTSGDACRGWIGLDEPWFEQEKPLKASDVTLRRAITYPLWNSSAARCLQLSKRMWLSRTQERL